VWAEKTKGAIQGVLYDPEARFETVLDKVALCGIAARIGAFMVDVESAESLGRPYPKILPRWVPSDSIAWHPSYDDPHDLRNPEFWHWCRWDTEQLKRVPGLKNVKLILPDGGTNSGGSETNPNITGMTTFDADGSPKLRDSGEIKFTTVAYRWERYVDPSETYEVMAPAGPDASYMKCSGCSYQSDPQGASEEPYGETGSCPMCGEQTSLTAGEDEAQELPFPDRKRLTIFAPKLHLELFVGPWPQTVQYPDGTYSTLRTFPVGVFVPDEFPGEPVGGSMTLDHRTNQLAIDMLMRVGLECMAEAKPYVALPDGEVKDFEGQPWEFRPEQGLGIYYNPMAGGDGVRLIQSNGAPAALLSMWQAFTAELNQNSGTGDVALTADQVKGTTASTLQQAIETGEIPIDHVIQKFRRMLTPVVGVILDMLRAVLTPEQAIRYEGEDGMETYEAIHGQQLPNADVSISAEPELARIDSEEAVAWQRFVTETPPEFYEFLGTRMRLPMLEIRKLEEAAQARMDREGQMAGGMGGGPGLPGGANALPGQPGSAPPPPLSLAAVQQ